MTVPGLTSRYGYNTYHFEPLMSPRQDAAAVLYCNDFGKYQPCTVFLARPGQPVMTLKNSDVLRLLWSADGRYLVGAGKNTVRLWNLVGGVRTTNPAGTPVLNRIRDAQITALKLSGLNLCVLLREDWYKPNGSGQPAQTSLTTARYSLPTLKLIQRQTSNIDKQPGCQN